MFRIFGVLCGNLPNILVKQTDWCDISGYPKPLIRNLVKHLLIIFSILLPSSPVFGQETGVLYQYETSSGIKWKTFGDGTVQPKYEGKIGIVLTQERKKKQLKGTKWSYHLKNERKGKENTIRDIVKIELRNRRIKQ